MNRSNRSNLSDPSMAAAAPTAAVARSAAGTLVIGCIFAIAALTACQPQRAAVGRSVGVGVSQPAVPQGTDATLDNQLRLDPSEIEQFSQNIHG